MYLTDHFDMDELEHTDHEVSNECPQHLAGNALRQAQLLEDARVLVGPLQVSSWYRSNELNKLVGGEPTSYHLDALATDVVPRGNIFSAFKTLVASGLEYDKIIYEKRSSEWIHIQSAHQDAVPRKIALVATPGSDGNMHYELFAS